MKNAANTVLALAALALTFPAHAQVPVDDDGNEIGSDFSTESVAPLLSNAELEELVAPIALYPDELLAIVLPASTYPLQVVEAARFLEAVETDTSLEPDEDWDDSIVALLNYPEVVELLNEDLDWTWTLGEAVVAQQADVLTAVDAFRDRAYAAGNLKTDEYQVIEENDDGIIEISPVAEDVIYVPYYEPERVVVYQPQPVYHYYARPYPVYYYPYSASYVHYGPFWGVTTAFTIGWVTNSVHVWHHSYYGHPYYGRYYRDYWWYRRPALHVHNSIYYHYDRYPRRHYRYGDYWRPRVDRRHYSRDQRITRSRHYRGNDRRRTEYTRASRREAYSRSGPNRSGFVGRTQDERRDRAARDDRRRDSVTRQTTRRTDGSNRVQRSQRERTAADRRRNDATRRAGSTGTRQSNNAVTTRRQSVGSAGRVRNERQPAVTRNGNREQRSATRRDAPSFRAPQKRAREEVVRQRVERSQRPAGQTRRTTRVEQPRRQQYANAGRSSTERRRPEPRRSAPTLRRAPPAAASTPRSRPAQRHSSPRPPSRSSAPAPSRSSAPPQRKSAGANNRPSRSAPPSRQRNASSTRGQSSSRERRR